jgi:hypothetical protein
MYGHDLYYLPRTRIEDDLIYGEETYSEFNTQYFVEMYINGLITDYDFLVVMQNHANAKKIPNIGVLDRNTGLRYTPKQVMGYAGITGKVGFDGLE